MNDDAAMAQQRNQAGRDQVRVAYGAVPVILEAFPESDPVRAKIRESARDARGTGLPDRGRNGHASREGGDHGGAETPPQRVLTTGRGRKGVLGLGYTRS
jgi:hypothetical protein